jgi:TRAP-type C4-dicarboxylate transport system permease large subunit
VWGVVPFLVLMAIAVVRLCVFPEIATAMQNHYHGK